VDREADLCKSLSFLYSDTEEVTVTQRRGRASIAVRKTAWVSQVVQSKPVRRLSEQATSDAVADC